MYRLRAEDCGRLADIIQEARLHQRLVPSQERSNTPHMQSGQSRPLAELTEETLRIAHDLNNILTIILSRAQSSEEEDDSQRLSRNMASIRRAALDGAELVRRMQRVGEHPADPPFGEIGTNDLIRSSLQMIEPRWRQGRLSTPSTGGHMEVLEPDLAVTPSPAGCIYGDPSELRRALTNIISNAVDALPREQGRIEITSGQDGQWATIKITDNGPGIPAGKRRQIFEPYFTTKEPQGRGLGLSISRGIITRHGGMLEVESAEGQRSTFVMSLPLSRPRHREVSPAEHSLR